MLTEKEKIEKRQQLVNALNEAAELEHQFTCMYLFAAFSLKKQADNAETFNEADVERTRRWASVIYMVARQEMEHLAIVNQLLGAIGEPPCFHRKNFPVLSEFFKIVEAEEGMDSSVGRSTNDYFEGKAKRLLERLAVFFPEGDIPITIQEYVDKYARGVREVTVFEKGKEEIKAITELIDEAITKANGLKACLLPFLFTPFDVQAARRFTVMEGPFASDLILAGQKKIAANLLKWGHKDKEGACNCILTGKYEEWEKRFNNTKKEKEPESPNIVAGDIERTYEKIKNLFEELGDSIFVPPALSRQVEIISQYHIYLFAINDVASAKNGIELIIKQGEAVGSSPGFDSHFRHFYDITTEYEERLGIPKPPSTDILDFIHGNCADMTPTKVFRPYQDILSNPTRQQITDGNTIDYEYVERVFDLFNYGYKTMCFCLNGLYGWYSERENFPFLSQALRDIVFAPTMTMFVRTVGEILISIPSGTEVNGKRLQAAPNFDMEDPKNYFELKEPYNYDKQGQICLRSLKIEGTANDGDWQHAEQYSFYLDEKFYEGRFNRVVAGLEALYQDIDNSLGRIVKDTDQKAAILGRMQFAYENMSRMTDNFKRSYQDNVYKKFEA